MAAGSGSKKKPAAKAPAPAVDPAPPSTSERKPELLARARSALTAGYTVVARRYRPQRFEDVVGQDHVVQTLRNAIRLDRLAQAYLFCGTRGVGKTSMARIFAKCLNCVQGPTESPCQVCEICQAIASGQDIDVIEIDGASNNGVEQVRELRQNVSLRPSRSRFKIYYIDEVHMLSTGAFNALLKTLEEPPGHVKFFFATTEANKIPITVLSRCQRYDFAGITPDAIVETLQEICTLENVKAQPEALQVVARRAGGSMRDAQSLLERLLASGSPELTVEVVHALLGTPSDERLLEMLEALAGRDPGAVLTILDQAALAGVQATDLLAGVLEFLRDAMVMAVGAESAVLAASPRQKPRLQAIVDRWPLDSILAALQILAEARSRMRGVSHGRLLAELALVRVARLEDLIGLDDLVSRLSALESGSPAPPRSAAPSTKKKLVTAADSPAPAAARPEALSPRPEAQRPTAEPVAARTPPSPAVPAHNAAAEARPAPQQQGTAPARPAPRQRAVPLEVPAIRQVWPELVKKVGMDLGWRLSQAEVIAIEEPDVLVIAAKPGYNSVADSCDTDEAREKISHCLQRLLHRTVTVRYERSSEPGDGGSASPAAASRRPDHVTADPLVRKVVELFEARPLNLVHEDDAESA